MPEEKICCPKMELNKNQFNTLSSNLDPVKTIKRTIATFLILLVILSLAIIPPLLRAEPFNISWLGLPFDNILSKLIITFCLASLIVWLGTSTKQPKLILSIAPDQITLYCPRTSWKKIIPKNECNDIELSRLVSGPSWDRKKNWYVGFFRPDQKNLLQKQQGWLKINDEDKERLKTIMHENGYTFSEK